MSTPLSTPPGTPTPDTPSAADEAPSLGLDLGPNSGPNLGPDAGDSVGQTVGLGVELAPTAAPELVGPGPVAAPQMAQVYRVLARKYRPSGFEDLIGQEAMVQTLTNAFKLNRIHQAYLLTGVRGVGKTTTARILARAFNYEVPATATTPAITAPTIHMPVMGVHCQAIIESRHIDVIEMDAASNTGVDDVREIIEGARFRPVMARTKVYIIDEVHMLSKSAFNALLKTLEEPPDHVKFLFATTEIDKVPITVRSRCQRFDLRRVAPDILARHLAGICAQEHVAVEPEALALVARAAEGSVRDALSVLDQAIAHGSPANGSRDSADSNSNTITADGLRSMLGVADRTRLMDMWDALMRGAVAPALEILNDQYNQGADPGHILADLAEFVHFVTRLKIAPPAEPDPAVPPEEHKRGLHFAATLSLSVLSRAWQILSKGMQEVKDSPRPLAAADMVLVRLAYAADLPSPEDLLRRLSSQPADASRAGRPHGLPPGSRELTTSGANAPSTTPMAAQHGAQNGTDTGPSGSTSMMRVASSSAGSGQVLRMVAPQATTQLLDMPTPDPAPRVRLTRFEDVVTLAGVHRDIQLKIALERDVRLVRFDQGAIDFALSPGASPQIAQTLMRRLQEWTGQRWLVAVSREDGAPSLKEQADERDQAQRLGVRAHPLIQQVLTHFPGAEIVAIRAPDVPAVQPSFPGQDATRQAGAADLPDDIGYGPDPGDGHDAGDLDQMDDRFASDDDL